MSQQPHTTAEPARWVGPALVFTGAVAVAYSPIGLRLSEFGPHATAFWRFLLALPVLLAAAMVFRLKLQPPSLAALMTGVFFGTDINLWHMALHQTSVANATFIVNLGAVFSGLAAWLVLRERPSALWPLAALVAVVGAALLSLGAGAGGSGAIAGDLLACVAAVALGSYFLCGRVARQSRNAISVVVWATLASTLVSLAFSMVRQERIIPHDLAELAAPFSISIIAHCLGQGLILAGLGLTPAAISGILILMQPLGAALIAWPLFGEKLSPLQMLGGGLILGGVWLAGAAQPRKVREAAADSGA